MARAETDSLGRYSRPMKHVHDAKRRRGIEQFLEEVFVKSVFCYVKGHARNWGTQATNANEFLEKLEVVFMPGRPLQVL